MSVGYFEYIAEHGEEKVQTEAERTAEKAEARRIVQEQADKEEIIRLKSAITAQFEQGAGPEYIAYNAIKCVGLLSHDREWSDSCTAQLDAVYSDLAQQSLLVDNAAIAGQRLDAQRQDFISKTQKALERQLKMCRKLTDEVTAALATVNEMENQNQNERTEK